MAKSTFLAENLKFYRKKNDWTQELMASKIGIKRSLLAAYEEGRAEPGLLVAVKISKLFDVSIECLISKDRLVFEEKDQIMDNEIHRKFGLLKHLVADIELKISNKILKI